MGRRWNNDYYEGWPAYVPVARRRRQAKREVEKLRKKGKNIQPVEIDGRIIARSFWGKGWCTHLESFGDYSNRLPRGRSYVRNGSVCHLVIQTGKVEAMVFGSELYIVTVDITPLKKKQWNTLKKRCTGKIGSLIELLQGKLSEEIMSTVIDRQSGLFPRPGEIRYHCDCPDWAEMCKHISAVMYGIGARLDLAPELLFLLRGVDHEELIAADTAADALAGRGSRRARRRSLSGEDLKNVFGVELDDRLEEAPLAPPKRRPVTMNNKPNKPGAKTPPSRTRKTASFKPTARSVARLRHRMGMGKAAFARAIGVSTATIVNWESATGPIKPQAKGLAGLTRLNNRGR